MHGFGAFFFIAGVLVLLFSPVVGVLFMILGLIMMGAAAARRKELRQAAAEAARVPCPHCAELVLPEAKVCRFCGRDLASAKASAGPMPEHLRAFYGNDKSRS